MTKEKLIEELTDVAREVSVYRIEGILQRFLESNVVIPKGENRHPSSDVLHLAIEGIKIQGWNHTKNEWEDDISWFIDKNDLDYPTKYRIKPSEPVYEWQWDTKLPDSTWQYYKEGDKTHFTDEEIGAKANWLSKVEHTKRERK